MLVLKIKGVSASSYKSYASCEWKWALSYGMGFYDEAGPAALLGNMVHKILEVFSKASVAKVDSNHPVFDPVLMWELWFNRYYNNHPEISSKIKNDKLKKVSKGFYDLLNGPYTPIRDNTISVEQYFRIPLEEKRFKLSPKKDDYFTIRGLADRIDQLDKDTIEIIDYKTGSRSDFFSNSKEKYDNITLRNDIQPRMYHLAATYLYPKIKNYLITFVYLTDGGPVTMPFTASDTKETLDVIYKRFQTIKYNENPERNLTWRCRFCGFGDKTGICDKVWKEKNHLGLEFISNKYYTLNVKK